MQEINCWLITPNQQFHWIHLGRVATSPLVCNLLAGWWCWQSDTRGPKLLMRVIAQQRLGSRQGRAELWLPASVISCTSWEKLTWVICKLWITNYMKLSPNWSRQHSSLLSWLKLSVCEDQILLFSNNHWVDQLKESASGLIMMKFPGISSELRAVSVSFLILWLISSWARERQKPYFCWNWF